MRQYRARRATETSCSPCTGLSHFASSLTDAWLGVAVGRGVGGSGAVWGSSATGKYLGVAEYRRPQSTSQPGVEASAASPPLSRRSRVRLSPGSPAAGVPWSAVEIWPHKYKLVKRSNIYVLICYMFAWLAWHMLRNKLSKYNNNAL